MKRLLVFALAFSIGNVPVAFAGETILKSGARHVREMAVAESSVQTQASTQAQAPAALPAGAVVQVGKKTTPSYQQDNGNLSKSGMGKGTKILIYAGLAAGFIASVWVIDHNVLDITPSSLGTRQD
jgi:cytoskeletal protein RodZ